MAKSSAAPVTKFPPIRINGFHSNAQEYAVSILSDTPRGQYFFHCGQFNGDGEQFQANINYMVKSWNAHQALYEALSALVGQIETSVTRTARISRSQLDKAKSALALADAAQGEE